MVATLCFVLFFQLSFAKVALTCSGSFMLHRFERRFRRATAVSIVESALPSFFICHA